MIWGRRWSAVRARLVAAPMIVVASLAAPLVDVLQSAARSGPDAPEPEVATMERQVVERVNEIRREHGAQPLEVDRELARIARDYSCRMARQEFFAHEAPDGGGIGGRLRAARKPFRAVGENLARNLNAPDPVDAAFGGWMQSEGHRKNILRQSFTETGVGICRSERGYHFTQIFLRPPSVGRRSAARLLLASR